MRPLSTFSRGRRRRNWTKNRMDRRYGCWTAVVLVAAVASSSFLLLIVDATDDADDDKYDAVCSSSASTSTNNQAEGEEESYRDHILQCGIYMAPSTLGNASNLGIFTAHPLEANSVLNYPELVIPLAFREWGTDLSFSTQDGELWDRYLWTGSTANIESFDTYDRTAQKSVFVPGIGCTINSVLDLHNLDSTHGSEYDAVVDRSHPAAGSFSPYHSSLTTTTESVPAGAELFAEYGESWIPWIPNIPILQDANLDRANELLQDLGQWTKDMKDKYNSEHVSDALLDRLYQLIHDFPSPASKTFTVLPPTREDWRKTVADDDATRTYWRSKYQVSVEWLQTSDHAKCQDHMKPGRSTIPHAGRGAFATRFLPKGAVVGYAPLIHVAYTFDEMTQVQTGGSSTSTSTTGEDGNNKKDDQQQPQDRHPDLIWNYSFGHPNSTLVLTPYGGMVNYINHAPTATGRDDNNKNTANVRVQWPRNELIAHKPDWLHKDVDFMRYATDGVGVSFDYIALRDIQEGEEIFMDYGEEWQAAWDEHVQQWQVPDDANNYVHSSQYQVDRLKTPAELREDPYPSNLVTICAESYRASPTDGAYIFVSVLRDWKVYVPCEVVSRTSGNRYTVKLTISSTASAASSSTTTDDKTGAGETTTTITVYNVPYPQGIKLVDRAYSQDWHLPNAFRHKLMIPDDIFPSAWRNLESSK